ncbi:MAG: CapA family protein [Candidatus Binatia bacterium]
MSRAVLHAVGDIGIVGRIADDLPHRASPFPFQDVASSLSAADFVFGNLEMPFSGGATIAAHESARLETPEAAAERLAAAGYTVLSLANNHVMDFGPSGLAATRRLLAEHGIESVGAGANLAEARRPVVAERRGVRAGFLAYCVPCRASAARDRPGAAPLDLDLVREDLAEIRPRVDCAIVSLHFGMMYLAQPTPADMAAARDVLAAGADLVIGHHPHVLQGIEETPRGTIAYSLGEFVFDPEAGNYYARVARQTRRRSLILRAEIGGRPPRLLPALPTLASEDLSPRILEGAAAEEARASLAELSRTLDDPVERARFWDYAGERLLAYQLSGLWFEIRRGHFRHLLERVPRIRPRHLRLVLGYLRSALSGRRSAAP